MKTGTALLPIVLLFGCASDPNREQSGKRADTPEETAARGELSKIRPDSPSDSRVDEILVDQREKMARSQRLFREYSDLGEHRKAAALAKKRYAELERTIRTGYKLGLSDGERERLMRPLREERDFQLKILAALQ